MNFQYISYSDETIPLRTAQCQGKGDIVYPHYHEAMELLLVEKGSLSAFVNGKNFDCFKGDILLVPCNSVHYASSKNSDTKIKSLYFHPSLVCNNEFDINPEKILNRELAFSYILKGEQQKSLIDVFENTYILGSQKRLQAAEVMSVIAGLYTLLSEYIKLVPHDGETVHGFNRISPAITYIKENLHRPIRIKELSAILFVCDDHLIRLFKSTTNKTPARYIMDARIEKAMQLLSKTELSIAEISEAVGFSSPNFMAKVFKESLHISPKDYRKQKNKS